MSMKWTENLIARAISRQTLARKCLVLVDNCNWTGHECDVLGVTMDLRIIDIEVKISRADLKADAKKEKWWNRVFTGYTPEVDELDESGKLIACRQSALYDSTELRHPPKVWKHYYALPKEIWKPELADCLPSTSSGILLLRHGDPKKSYEPPVVVTCARRATPAKDAYRLKPEQALDIARLANLRMWSAYEKLEQSRKAPELEVPA